MNTFLQELKIALQCLRHKSGFVITVVMTLSITLGALITFFNLNHVLLVKSLPYPDHERLQLIHHELLRDSGERDGIAILVPGLLHTYKHQQHFEQMTILSTGYEFLTSHQEQPRLTVSFTTPEYFSLIDVPMALGRSFNQSEGLESNRPVVVLSYQSWHKWFQGDMDIVGRTLQLRNTRYTIIGVTAEHFNEPEIVGDLSDIWAPWDFNGMSESTQKSWNNAQANIAGLGKLKTNTSIVTAQSEMSQSLNRVYQDFLLSIDNPNNLSANIRLTFKSLKRHLVGDSHLQAMLLLAAVFALLIIACTNVINLFYSRAAEKQRTFAIQAALGAKKKHLFVAMFAESLVLMFASVLMGLVIAMWGIDLVKSLGQAQFNRLHELGLNTITVLFAILLGILLAAIFSLLSSRVVNYDKLQEQLQTSGKGSGMQISKRRRNSLVVSQIFLACLLLVGSSLVLGQAFSVINQPLGYDKSVLRSFSLDERAGLIQADEMARRDQYMNDITTRLQQLPQIVSVAPSFNTAIGYNMTMELIDRDNNLHGTFPTNFVAANYFETMQILMLEGRNFNTQEVRERAPVAIVSRSVAQKIGQGRSVLGMKFTIGGGDIRTVVGVVDDVYDPVRNESNQSLDAYLPHAPWNVHFIIRLTANADFHREQLVSLIKDVNPGLRLANYREFTDRHNNVIRQDRITAGVAAGLSLLALLLAGTGIYGVLSYSSQMRRYELGVRMALGAKSHQISALVIKDNMRPITLGLMLSMLVIAIIYGFGHYQLGWFKAYSLIPILLTLPIILLTAFFASYFPVRSVIRNDPVKALRNEYT